MAMISGTLAKIADEIRCLARSETGECEEPFQMGKVGSSTMPHKRNPELCEQVVVLSKLIKANAGLGFDGMINEHERDYRAVRLEWVTLTDSSLFICGLLSIMKTILDGLIVHEKTMARNLDKAATLISTEALMFRLGDAIGKQKAHQLIYEASMKSIEDDISLIDLLMDHEEITASFTREDIEAVVDPTNHIGMSGELSERVVAHVKRELSKLPAIDSSTRRCPLAGTDGSCSV
jgi:adenylosuccinate lyase